MASVTVHWRHAPFAQDAGERDSGEVARTDSAVARTGVLTDDAEYIVDDQPVLVEDETLRVYRAADLPPDTTIYVAAMSDPPQPVVDRARRAGFAVDSAANG